jgi:uncharacterized membrane protein
VGSKKRVDDMASIVVISKLGGIVIWAWKRFVKKDKNVDFSDEYYGYSWLHWILGTIVIFLLIIFCIAVVMPLENWMIEHEYSRRLP